MFLFLLDHLRVAIAVVLSFSTASCHVCAGIKISEPIATAVTTAE
jgi:hypothetical protein